jgi:hypothetical protein
MQQCSDAAMQRCSDTHCKINGRNVIWLGWLKRMGNGPRGERTLLQARPALPAPPPFHVVPAVEPLFECNVAPAEQPRQYLARSLPVHPSGPRCKLARTWQEGPLQPGTPPPWTA